MAMMRDTRKPTSDGEIISAHMARTHVHDHRGDVIGPGDHVHPCRRERRALQRRMPGWAPDVGIASLGWSRKIIRSWAKGADPCAVAALPVTSLAKTWATAAGMAPASRQNVGNHCRARLGPRFHCPSDSRITRAQEGTLLLQGRGLQTDGLTDRRTDRRGGT